MIMEKFTIVKTREVANVYEIEADSREEAIKMAREANPSSEPISVELSEWNLVHIEDGNGDIEEWEPRYDFNKTMYVKSY
tara:strand:- start:342 stop:581 length:240 start_codon:yes stop_codon:yes gene_type:complete